MEKTLLGVAVELIIAGDREAFIRILESLPLARISIDASNRILVLWLNLCAKYKRNDIAREILIHFNQLGQDNDVHNIQTFSYLFLLPEIEDATLRFLATNLNEYTFVEVIEDLIGYDGGDKVSAATQRAIDIFAINDKYAKTVHELYQQAEKEGNDAVAEVLQNNYQRYAPLKGKPEWVRNFMAVLPYEDEIPLPVLEVPSVQQPNSEDEEVDLLIAGMRDIGIGVNDIKEARAKLLQMDPEFRKAALRDVLLNRTNRNLQYEEELFRILGPANAVYGASLTSDHVCSRYGGDRMFTCVCFEVVDPEDDVIYEQEEVDWFTGSCDVCSMRIAQRYYAVRKPLVHGGWKGCYCSFDCVREDYDQPDLAAREIIAQVEADLKRIGIQDRISLDDLPSEEEETFDEKDIAFLQDNRDDAL